MENKIIITEEMYKNRDINTIDELCERYNLNLKDFGCILKMYEYANLTHNRTIEDIIDMIDRFFKCSYLTEHILNGHRVFAHLDNECEMSIIVDTEKILTEVKE